MKQRLHNLRYHTNEEPQNMLIFLFFYITFGFGFFYLTAFHTASVKASILFAQSGNLFGAKLIVIWSIAAIIVGLGSTIAQAFKPTNGGKSKFLSPLAIFGFMVWTYVFIVYALGGFWFQVATGAAPNMVFWAGYWISLKLYEKRNLKS